MEQECPPQGPLQLPWAFPTFSPPSQLGQALENSK